MLMRTKQTCAGLLGSLRDVTRRFGQSTDGVAGLEFAVVFPVMLIMLVGGFELSRAIAASTRATYLANSLAELASQATGKLTTNEINRIIETAPLQDPDLVLYAQSRNREDFWNVADITVSSVLFAKTNPSCEHHCSYEGDIVFSYDPRGHGRSCGKVSFGPGANELPASVEGQGSLVVVDIAVPYDTVFREILPVPVKFKRTVYLRPRYIDVVTSTNDCPGF